MPAVNTGEAAAEFRGRSGERFELRDLDGDYLFAEVIDETRCRVLVSNMTRPGTVLGIPSDQYWEHAAEELGGFTRLLPCEMLDYNRDLKAGERGEDDFEESLARAVDHEDEVVRESHERVEERARSGSEESAGEFDIDAWEDIADAYIRSLERKPARKQRKQSG